MELGLKQKTISPRRILKEVRAFFSGPGMIKHFIAKAQELEAIGEAISLEGHSSALLEIAAEFGKAAKLSEEEMNTLLTAVELHDIGKLPIPDGILKKPDRLTNKEFNFIKQHPNIGFLILWFIGQTEIAEVVLSHHERWDGKGYPFGRSGYDIPLLSRMISIIDAYDAMTCDRVYRNALSPKEAIDIIRMNAGDQFDPDLAMIFIGIWEKKYDDL